MPIEQPQEVAESRNTRKKDPANGDEKILGNVRGNGVASDPVLRCDAGGQTGELRMGRLTLAAKRSEDPSKKAQAWLRDFRPKARASIGVGAFIRREGAHSAQLNGSEWDRNAPAAPKRKGPWPARAGRRRKRLTAAGTSSLDSS